MEAVAGHWSPLGSHLHYRYILQSNYSNSTGDGGLAPQMKFAVDNSSVGGGVGGAQRLRTFLALVGDRLELGDVLVGGNVILVGDGIGGKVCQVKATDKQPKF